MQPESLLTEARKALPKLDADDCQIIEDCWMRELVAPQRIVIEDDERRAPANFIDNPSNSGPPPQGA
jgi:hypothetical protein